MAHSDVAPDRKEDPGEKFPWEDLAQEGVGLWPFGVPDLGTGGTIEDAAAMRKVRDALTAIGYPRPDDDLSAVLRAFQRHWRPEAVTGLADAGTVARAMAVAALIQGA